jgi:hypothetical protein
LLWLYQHVVEGAVILKAGHEIHHLLEGFRVAARLSWWMKVVVLSRLVSGSTPDGFRQILALQRPTE